MCKHPLLLLLLPFESANKGTEDLPLCVLEWKKSNSIIYPQGVTRAPHEAQILHKWIQRFRVWFCWIRFCLKTTFFSSVGSKMCGFSKSLDSCERPLSLSWCPWARHLTLSCSQWGGQHLAWQQPPLVCEKCEWMGEWEASVRQLRGTMKVLVKHYMCSPFAIWTSSSISIWQPLLLQQWQSAP